VKGEECSVSHTIDMNTYHITAENGELGLV